MRKEIDSFMTRCKQIFSHPLVERASPFTSKASMTVEAAFSVSFFFLAVMSMICLFEIMALQVQIKSALHSAGKEFAIESCSNPILYPERIERKLVAAVGEEKLDNSLIVGGSEGIDCGSSQMYWGTTIMDLCAYYEIEIPIMMFRIPVIAREEIVRVKGWTGAEERYISPQAKEIVYVTDYGIVYHKRIDCTYLELSIQAVSYEQLEELRNESGGKYSACEVCASSGTFQTSVYITDHGNRYHYSLECGGLNRNIYAVPLSDVYGIGGCSKCVK